MPYLTESDEIKQVIAKYSQAKTLWLDTEVADYNTGKPRLSLIQILDNSTDIKGENVVILDVLEQPNLVKEFIDKIMINSAIEKVIHNASYDCQFLGKSKAKDVTCTLKMVQKIPYYIVPLPNYQLKTLAEQLCHFPTIDKSEQGGDWGKRPLSEKQLNYARMDPVYVAQVHHRLLQLSQLIEPNPETENIANLILRYRQIESNWKALDTEITHIKERLKRAMTQQNLLEINGVKLASQKRTNKKVSLNELSKIIQGSGLQFDIAIKLTQEMQKQLSEILSELPIEEETEESLQLKISNLEEEEDIPF